LQEIRIPGPKKMGEAQRPLLLNGPQIPSCYETDSLERQTYPAITKSAISSSNPPYSGCAFSRSL
jgi:hypothetical protein